LDHNLLTMEKREILRSFHSKKNHLKHLKQKMSWKTCQERYWAGLNPKQRSLPCYRKMPSSHASSIQNRRKDGIKSFPDNFPAVRTPRCPLATSHMVTLSTLLKTAHPPKDNATCTSWQESVKVKKHSHPRTAPFRNRGPANSPGFDPQNAQRWIPPPVHEHLPRRGPRQILQPARGLQGIVPGLDCWWLLRC
jgi:hypothetical protein